MKIGQIYVQRHAASDIYVMPTRQLKNGGYYGLQYEDMGTGSYGGKAKHKSLAHMYPAPVEALDIDPSIAAKFRR